MAQDKHIALSIHDNLPIDYYERDDFGHVKKSITIREANDENCNSYFCLEALMALTDDKDLVKKIINNKGFKADNYDIKYKIY